MNLKIANIGMKFGMSHVEGAMSYGAEIAAICDSDEENLRFAGERYNIPKEKWVSDYREIAENPDIDAVTVAVPDQLHKQISCEMLRAGKHVLCEKPLALSRAEAQEVFDIAEQQKQRT